MSDQQYLFVYGTLRQAFSHKMGRLVANQAIFMGPGSLQGKLYDLGAYPGVIPSNQKVDIVMGEVYALREGEELLVQLDHYEGYRPKHPERSLYLRQLKSVTLKSGTTLQAWVYIYNRPVAGRPVIESGDYVAYCQSSSLR
jgi:gamma-glutamylcyclotransferase (GGCT)/AIG2-like uncharacterized protein YtfP